jgi:16S rRNA processing protein RimM
MTEADKSMSAAAEQGSGLEGPGEAEGAERGSGEALSPEPLRYLAVGRISKPHGIYGWVKMQVWTDFPERFKRPGVFFLGPERKRVRLTGSRVVAKGMLIKLAGYDTPEAADGLREQELYIPIEAAMPLPPGEVYQYQLIGLEVWTDAGERLGVVKEVWENPANNVYVVEHEGKTVLLPATREVILGVDLEQRRLNVHLMEGLLP